MCVRAASRPQFHEGTRAGLMRPRAHSRMGKLPRGLQVNPDKASKHAVLPKPQVYGCALSHARLFAGSFVRLTPSFVLYAIFMFVFVGGLCTSGALTYMLYFFKDMLYVFIVPRLFERASPHPRALD